jgi:hypothetical protein
MYLKALHSAADLSMQKEGNDDITLKALTQPYLTSEERQRQDHLSLSKEVFHFKAEIIVGRVRTTKRRAIGLDSKHHIGFDLLLRASHVTQ